MLYKLERMEESLEIFREIAERARDKDEAPTPRAEGVPPQVCPAKAEVYVMGTEEVCDDGLVIQLDPPRPIKTRRTTDRWRGPLKKEKQNTVPRPTFLYRVSVSVCVCVALASTALAS